MAFDGPTFLPQWVFKEKPVQEESYDKVSIPGYKIDKKLSVRRNGIFLTTTDKTMFSEKDFCFKSDLGLFYLVRNGVAVAKAHEIRAYTPYIFGWKNNGSKWTLNYFGDDILTSFSEFQLIDNNHVISRDPRTRKYVVNIISEVEKEVVEWKFGGCEKIVVFEKGIRILQFKDAYSMWNLVIDMKIVDSNPNGFSPIDLERWETRDKDGKWVFHDIDSYSYEAQAQRDGRTTISMGQNAFVWIDRNSHMNLVVDGVRKFSGRDVIQKDEKTFVCVSDEDETVEITV